MPFYHKADLLLQEHLLSTQFASEQSSPRNSSDTRHNLSQRAMHQSWKEKLGEYKSGKLTEVAYTQQTY
jgi:hypothetical protein